MKKTLKVTILSCFFFISFGLLVINNAYAQNGDETSGNLANLTSSDFANISPNNNNSGGGKNSTSKLIGGYSLNFLKPPKGKTKGSNLYMFTQSPSYDSNKIVQFFYDQYKTAITNPDANQGDKDIYTALTNFVTATSATTSNSIKKAMEQYFPLSDKGESYNFKDNKIGKSKSRNDIGSLDLNSLITPVQYGKNSEKTANEFIKYLTNQYGPEPKVDFSKLAKGDSDKALDKAFKSEKIRQYVYLLRRMAAIDSVGLSNLYYLYQQRVPQKTQDLLKNLPSNIAQNKLPKNLQKEASPLALQRWIATHRLSSEKQDDGTTPWVKAIENASPATLERETVYLLASIQQQMFQQRMLNERILATLSAQQLQSSGALQFKLNELEREICKSSVLKGTGACPPESTPSNIAESS